MLTTQQRDAGLSRALSAALAKQIKESRVLLVGSGGIGCEVLKNLVCCGFGSSPGRGTAASNGQIDETSTSQQAPPGITLVDLDTIDLSNLNRQFLFRKQHIKQPKAFVAKATASAFNPAVNIDALHASIFDDQFNVDFFQGFDIVFNALDNIAARRHVNRMCLAADVPLIESGTTGYNGQVQAIKKGVTECYDCNEKPVQKSFAICTIRSTPSQPIHCIVWAKSYLLPELFGDSDDQAKDMTETAEDNAEEVLKLREEAEALQKIKSGMHEPGFAKAVFDKVYGEDIKRLASMTEMWKNKAAPEPLRFDENIWTNDPITRGKSASKDMQRIWTMEENAAVFCSSLDALVARVKDGGEATIEFDKDDKDTLDFVTSAANLRAHIFKIGLNSQWQTKQMAGNIIPAIATSNAMTASLCVSQAFKILRTAAPPLQNNNKAGRVNTPLGGCKMTFLTSKTTERMITTEALRPPNPHCPVCSPVYAKLSISLASSATLQDLVDLLKSSTCLENFSVTVFSNNSLIYDPEEEENLEKPLAAFGIAGDKNDFVLVQDEDNKVPLLLSLAAHSDEPALRLSPASIALPDRVEKPTAPAADESEVTTGLKRKREDDDANVTKRPKTNGNATDSEVIEIDNDGTILLDD